MDQETLDLLTRLGDDVYKLKKARETLGGVLGDAQEDMGKALLFWSKFNRAPKENEAWRVPTKAKLRQWAYGQFVILLTEAYSDDHIDQDEMLELLTEQFIEKT